MFGILWNLGICIKSIVRDKGTPSDATTPSEQVLKVIYNLQLITLLPTIFRKKNNNIKGKAGKDKS